MKHLLWLLIPLTVAAIYEGGCNSKKVQDIKAHSREVLSRLGYVQVGYEGYELGNIFESRGGRVWYTFYYTNNPAIIYDGCITKWYNEYHVYNIKALNALSPK